MSECAQTSGTGPDLPVAVTVIEAIADAEGVAADQLDPIHEFVDLDALESLVTSGDEELRVRWSVNDHRVEVDGTGAVRVE